MHNRISHAHEELNPAWIQLEARRVLRYESEAWLAVNGLVFVDSYHLLWSPAKTRHRRLLARQTWSTICPADPTLWTSSDRSWSWWSQRCQKSTQWPCPSALAAPSCPVTAHPIVMLRTPCTQLYLSSTAASGVNRLSPDTPPQQNVVTGLGSFRCS